MFLSRQLKRLFSPVVVVVGVTVVLVGFSDAVVVLATASFVAVSANVVPVGSAVVVAAVVVSLTPSGDVPISTNRETMF